ncbi:MAG: hypothetical protein CL454_00555 [Acidimicrobiaceae bacterium]|nr:hypothetical protein [Acidimicrobiaceae bacterium]|tara:strand:+ start:486 stop:1127 length:642 start_codon:yes stop_codon:yes gene_type:complete
MGQRHSSQRLQGALSKVIRVFEAENIEYALAYGTLLGVVREDRPINGDDDVDFFIAPNQWEKAVATMEKHFFSLRQMQNLLIYPHFKTFMVDNVQVDLYKLHDTEDGRTIDCWNEHVFPREAMYPFLRHGQYSVPKNPQRLLAHVYGQDWRVPRGGKDYPSPDEKTEASLQCAKVLQPRRLGPITVGLIVVVCSAVAAGVAAKCLARNVRRRV